jgi:hypothetical protein
VDARPVADPSAGGDLVTGACLRRSLALAGALLLIAGPGFSADDSVARLAAPYLQARSERALGTVTATAYVETVRPNADPAPRPSVSVTLLPYSAAFEAELDAAKEGLRDSPDAYVQTVARIEAARVDYESGLVAAGAGELVRTEMTSAQGTAALGDVPAGDWLVLAWREGGHLSKRFKLRETEASRFPNVTTSVTYSVVTFWRARVVVRAGETAEVTMHDRNVWLTAARQEGGTPVTPRRPPGSGTKRR